MYRSTFRHRSQSTSKPWIRRRRRPVTCSARDVSIDQKSLIRHPTGTYVTGQAEHRPARKQIRSLLLTSHRTHARTRRAVPLLGHASAPVDAGGARLDASPAGTERAENSVPRRGGYSGSPDHRASARGAQGLRQGCSRGNIQNLSTWYLVLFFFSTSSTFFALPSPRRLPLNCAYL